MARTKILRQGYSKLEDLANGRQAFGDAAAGNVFFVNGITWANGFATGSDANDGSFEAPFMSLTYALSKCTTEANDYIYILDYYQPTGETWPVVVNKNLVNIIGVGKSPLTNWVCMYASGSYSCMDITGSDVYIEGISFYPNSAKPGVTMDSGCKNVWINDCCFAQGTAGVYLEAGDTSFGISITNSFFLSSLSAGGIDVNDDPAGLFIDGNHFDRLTGDAINITQGAYHVITNNTFCLKANTEGLAITLGSSVSRAFVDNNSAGYGTATTTSPYDDEGTVTTNSWGRNFLGGTQIAPV